jgi:hypothetical protein
MNLKQRRKFLKEQEDCRELEILIGQENLAEGKSLTETLNRTYNLDRSRKSRTEEGILAVVGNL